MRSKAAYLSAMFLLSCSSVATAGPLVDAAERAEALQAEGKTVEALEALDEAIDALWTEGSLAFRKVVLVESAGALGTFEERSDRSYKPDDKLRVYVEPVGFGYGQSGDAAEIGFTADLSIENTTGQVLTEVQDLFTIAVESAPGRREFGMTLAFGVPYLRPGEYIGRFTVHDQNSDKTGTFDVPFTVAAPGAGGGAQGGGEDGPTSGTENPAPAASSGTGAGGTSGGAAAEPDAASGSTSTGGALGSSSSGDSSTGSSAGGAASGSSSTNDTTGGTSGSTGGAASTTGSSNSGSSATGGSGTGSSAAGGSTGSSGTGSSTGGSSAAGSTGSSPQ